MGQINRVSLVWKAVAVLVLVFALATVAVAVSSAWRVDDNLTKQFEARGIAIADGFASSSVEVLLFRDVSTAQSMIDQYKNLDGVAYVLIVNPKGEILAHTFIPNIPAEVRNLKVDKRARIVQPLSVTGIGDVINITSPILDGEVGHVHVGMERKLIQDTIWSALREQLVLLGIIFFISLGLTILLIRKIIQPLAKLTDYANTLANVGTSSGNHAVAEAEVLTIASRADEVGQLAKAFRYLIDKVSAHEQKLRSAHDGLEVRVRERTAELQSQQQAAVHLAQVADDASQRAARSEERLNLALKSSGVGTWDWNLVEDTLFWDDYIHPLFGLKPGTFAGTFEAAMDLIHPDESDRVKREVAHTIEQDAEYDSEFRVVWPDGTIHVIGARGKVYRDQMAKPLRMTGVCWDVTQRRLIEDERDRLVSILEATTDFVAMARTNGRVFYVNRAGRKIVGMGETTPASETTIPDYHPHWANEIVMEQGLPTALREGVWSGEIALLRRDGTEVPVSQVIQCHKNDRGEVQYFSTIMRDISDRKQAEQDLKRSSQELTRSNTELEQFAYIASHDLQEPLRKVQAFGDLLAEKAGPTLGEEERDYLKRMQAAAQRMQGLINDLLAFARVTSQAKPFIPVDLTHVAREVLADLEVRVKMTGGRVELGELPHLESDPLQMRQLLQNLIGNALKFHRPDVPPVIVVESHVANNGDGLTLGHSHSDQVCEITVRDNGIGFEEKYLDRIFLPFQRLHGRGEYEGTGMGLAICRKIVERHGGTITAHSTLGQGTTFSVLLPIYQPKGE